MTSDIKVSSATLHSYFPSAREKHLSVTSETFLITPGPSSWCKELILFNLSLLCQGSAKCDIHVCHYIRSGNTKLHNSLNTCRLQIIVSWVEKRDDKKQQQGIEVSQFKIPNITISAIMLISISSKQTLKFIINSNCCNTTPPHAARWESNFMFSNSIASK